MRLDYNGDIKQYNEEVAALFKITTNTSTREDGKIARNDVLKTIENEKQSHIILDFSNAKSISSAFIDEFIGKLVIKYGVIDFANTFSLIGMSSTAIHLCNRSVFARISGLTSD